MLFTGNCSSFASLNHCKHLQLLSKERNTYMFDKRFLNKVEVLENGCWLWKASERYRHEGATFRPQVLSYMVANKLTSSPSGYVYCTCDRTLCVNPEHLELKAKFTRPSSAPRRAYKAHHEGVASKRRRIHLIAEAAERIKLNLDR